MSRVVPPVDNSPFRRPYTAPIAALLPALVNQMTTAQGQLAGRRKEKTKMTEEEENGRYRISLISSVAAEPLPHILV
jgi:hypothetical protein